MQKYDIAAYIWPAYSGKESRNHLFWPEKIGEWQTVKNQQPKENGYFFDRRPIWGYQDEADPEVMAFQINEAVRHGVNVFIYDWYWYDNRPFQEQCLNDGFLGAPNNADMKFYLMWANHDANNYWDIRTSDDPETVVWQGRVSREQFEGITDRLISRYFCKDNYYKINGCPVFEIYDINNLISSFGGIDAALTALEHFRDKVKAAGFPDLHLQMTIWSEGSLNLSGFDKNRRGSTRDFVRLLGFDSVTHYQFVHFSNMNRSYPDILRDVEKEWARIDKEYDVPYYPHVSVGWDNNPRFKRFIDCVCRDNTPENFEKGLRMAKDYLDRHPERAKLITVNSWNEWTECSYLQPDTVTGYGYLEAVRRVFCENDE